MDWELWGTFSVGDHLRRRAFIADVLLYDRLVVPVPPAGDEDEQARWRRMGWRPGRQQELLELIGRDFVIPVPWTDPHRQQWESRYEAAKGAAKGAVRAELAGAAKQDVAFTTSRRQEFERRRGHDAAELHRALMASEEKEVSRRGQPDEVDALAHHTTRLVLVDWSNMRNDTELFLSLPRVEVDAVAAYASFQSFKKDHPLPLTDAAAAEAERLLHVFGWEFLVPADSERSDTDLLKQAVELAHADEIRSYRRAFHRWRRNVLLRGASPEEAREEMEAAISDYSRAVRRKRIKTAVKNAFLITTAAAPVGALALGPLAIVGAFSGLGHLIASKALRPEAPEQLEMAAMFHDARKRFGWR
jgi:hypothetical protein